jgi:hypothetical protein
MFVRVPVGVFALAMLVSLVVCMYRFFRGGQDLELTIPFGTLGLGLVAWAAIASQNHGLSVFGQIVWGVVFTLRAIVAVREPLRGRREPSDVEWCVIATALLVLGLAVAVDGTPRFIFEPLLIGAVLFAWRASLLTLAAPLPPTIVTS